MTDPFGPQFLSDLRRGIAQSFTLDELRTLCADLGVEFEDIPGETREGKARELIAHFRRRGRLAELIEYCRAVRPDYPWDGATGQAVAPRAGKLTVLFLAADPGDQARLRQGQELREIQEKLQLARLRDRFTLEQRLSVRPADLSQALLDVQPDVVHFSGHGAAAGGLAFEDVAGRTHLIAPQALAALFEQFAGQVHCIVLNACYSETQAQALAAHIDYVVGMPDALSDEAALAFTIGFYQGLGAGRSYEEAYRLGCVQIGLQGVGEEPPPVLIRKK